MAFEHNKVLIFFVIILILSSGVYAFRSAMGIYGARSAMGGGLSLFGFGAGDNLNFKFEDLTDNCTLHSNINVSDPNYCSINEEESFVYFENNSWNILCCDFTSKCSGKTYSSTTDICEDNLNNTYSGFIYNSNNKWLAYCCDENGDNCYVDTNVFPDNEATICDQKYTTSIMSLDYNADWDAMCCVGGTK